MFLNLSIPLSSRCFFFKIVIMIGHCISFIPNYYSLPYRWTRFNLRSPSTEQNLKRRWIEIPRAIISSKLTFHLVNIISLRITTHTVFLVVALCARCIFAICWRPAPGISGGDFAGNTISCKRATGKKSESKLMNRSTFIKISDFCLSRCIKANIPLNLIRLINSSSTSLAVFILYTYDDTYMSC